MRYVLSATLTILLACPVFAEQRGSYIKDGAKLFSAAAIEQANKVIADIQEKYGIELFVETMTEIPGADASRLMSMKPPARATFLRQTAEKRAEELGVNGLYLLVTTHPKNTLLIGWPKERESEDQPLEAGGGLSYVKRDEQIRRPFARNLSDNWDEDLLALVDHFRMAVHSRETLPRSPLSTMAATVIVAVMVGVWLLLSLLRRVVARRQAASAEEPIGTLYQPAMLGSMFGVPAGFWVYDRLFRGERKG